ncbi:amino acid/polyamine/organocation transporter, APC superfamily [Coemansia reversa NRRL 1564]|uniref:Amino acid/polyamine/organocation transporter, APC superfamily n=1 Tax=Coemansia reversa (strain ATCC 12441 / NRRL 1564) TaxID=763665 RepID=A0A2G5B3L3_COERN|nr:amino acid/polyamine/organocation transporter, APC superfamily [Coemansia reversa NRRL 1564]|eukprot:PIA13610.1 amino acid/polyamine/organocation transporter, APC superfamily [Coemansia reversa NRRL 1564]
MTGIFRKQQQQSSGHMLLELATCLRLIARKPLEVILQEGSKTQMRRVLGRLDLIAVGIGAIIGTGIFVLTGVAAAENAGPAIIISFMIAGLVSGLSAFSYSELASMVPISGSAYTYTYATMGEFMAWIIGWDLILEYLVGAATVAVGWSAYVVSFFKDVFGVEFTKKTTQAPVLWDNDELAFKVNDGAYINIPAIFIALLMTLLLVFGIRQSSWLNQTVVCIKIVVVLFFIFGACKYVDRKNYQPFVPPREGNSYGAKGVFKGTQRVFFAYIGFDAVSTAAQEAKNPQKDLPWGICASLTICTVLYIAVSTVLCGIISYKELNVASPLTFALEFHDNTRWLRILIEIGAIAGLSSVILILLMGQPRILFTMARDGMFPKIFGRLHHRFKTPYVPTIVAGVVCAVLAGVLPVDILGDMTSVGTLLAFILVNVGVIIMRYTHPDAERGFKVPLGNFIIPIPGALIALVILVLSDGPTIYRLFIWLAVGVIVYVLYGYRHSRVGNPEKCFDSDKSSANHDHMNKSASVNMPEVHHYTSQEDNGGQNNSVDADNIVPQMPSPPKQAHL